MTESIVVKLEWLSINELFELIGVTVETPIDEPVIVSVDGLFTELSWCVDEWNRCAEQLKCIVSVDVLALD